MAKIIIDFAPQHPPFGLFRPTWPGDRAPMWIQLNVVLFSLAWLPGGPAEIDNREGDY